jgi:hypothetical protein
MIAHTRRKQRVSHSFLVLSSFGVFVDSHEIAVLWLDRHTELIQLACTSSYASTELMLQTARRRETLKKYKIGLVNN